MNNNKISFTFWQKNKELNKIFNILGKNKLHFVGGAVRNALSGTITEDIDIAANIEPNKLKNLLKKEEVKFCDFSKGHGTINLKLGAFNIEITSFREDEITYGRRAKIKYTNDIFVDSCRRDFTINSIYADFLGNLYDPHEGLKDLQDKTIKFVGEANKRIQEDYLRILRYFRFVAQYSKSIKNLDSNSLQACIENKLLIKNISKERIQIEFSKLLLANNASFSILLLKKYKIIDLIIEGLSKLKQKDIKNLDNIFRDLNVRLAYITIKANISLKQLKKHLKLSNKQENEIFLLVKDNEVIKNVKKAKALVYYYGNKLALQKYKLITILYGEKESKHVIDILKLWTAPTFPLSGKDLTKNGLKGRDIGITLKAVEGWWVKEGMKASKMKCLEKIKKH